MFLVCFVFWGADPTSTCILYMRNTCFTIWGVIICKEGLNKIEFGYQLCKYKFLDTFLSLPNRKLAEGRYIHCRYNGGLLHDCLEIIVKVCSTEATIDVTRNYITIKLPSACELLTRELAWSSLACKGRFTSCDEKVRHNHRRVHRHSWRHVQPRWLLQLNVRTF